QDRDQQDPQAGITGLEGLAAKGTPGGQGHIARRRANRVEPRRRRAARKKFLISHFASTRPRQADSFPCCPVTHVRGPGGTQSACFALSSLGAASLWAGRPFSRLPWPSASPPVLPGPRGVR